MTQIVSRDYYGNTYTFDEAEYIAHVSVYAVYIDTGRVLMIQDSKPGLWELPGGGVEAGEDEIDALRREVHEETGLSIAHAATLLTEFEEYYYDVPTKEPWRSTRKFYLVTGVQGEILANGNGDDTVAAGMVGTTEISHLRITDTIKSVLRAALKNTKVPTSRPTAGAEALLKTRPRSRVVVAA